MFFIEYPLFQATSLQGWAPNAYRWPYLKKRSVSLAIREMEIKTTLRALLTPVSMAKIKKTTTNTDRNEGKGEPSSTINEIANWCNHYGHQSAVVKKLGVDLPYDPAIPPLSIHPDT